MPTLLVRRYVLILALLAAAAASACGKQGRQEMEESTFATPQAAALYKAAAGGEMDRARQLLAAGENINAHHARELTLLEIAMLAGQRQAFDNLLTLGADPAHLGQARDTPMHLAAKLEDPYWLRAMLARGAPTEVRNRLGETPLFPALGPRTQANVQLLLDAGADIHARDLDKRTLLHEAADINSLTDVPLLLDLGVDPRAKDDLGYTFQKSFFDTPEHLLSDEAVTIRAKVRAWLQARGIAVEEKAARQGH